jgi:hypothetical protein
LNLETQIDNAHAEAESGEDTDAEALDEAVWF